MHDCFVIYSYVVHVEPFGNELLSFSNRKVQRFEVDLKSSLFWHFQIVLQIGIFKYLIIFDKNHAFEG